jgi:cardiolipin synthase
MLTMSRIASTPFINYFVYVDQHYYACMLFVMAAVTDFLDGYIARNWPNQQSNLGSILDPLADKLLICSLTVTLSLAHMLPAELAILILGRDIGLVLASLIVRYKTLEKPVTIEKYLNLKKYSSVEVKADQISKFNTFLQLSLISLTLPSVLFEYSDSSLLVGLQFLTGLTTVMSGISYLYKGGSYKLSNKK